MATQDKTPSTESQVARYVLSALISAGALGLGLVHIAFPDVKIDNYTIVLFVIGIAPWLAPLFKSIELPGGWKFEFKEFQRQVQEDLKKKDEKVEELQTRVQKVEQFAFSGAVDQTEKESLNAALVSYHDFLKGLGFDLSEEAPSVFIDTESKYNAYYDPGNRRIVIGKPFADDLDVLFHEYTHHVLMGNVSVKFEELDSDAVRLESGIADYFPCSFNNDSKLAEKMGAYLQSEGIGAKPYLRNLENERQFDEIKAETPPQDAGEVWGGVFWDMREVFGREAADAAIADAWVATGQQLSTRAAAVTFVQELAKAAASKLGQPAADHVPTLFVRRKFKMKLPARTRTRRT
jgi:hypothetical protein